MICCYFKTFEIRSCQTTKKTSFLVGRLVKYFRCVQSLNTGDTLAKIIFSYRNHKQRKSLYDKTSVISSVLILRMRIFSFYVVCIVNLKVAFQEPQNISWKIGYRIDELLNTFDAIISIHFKQVWLFHPPLIFLSNTYRALHYKTFLKEVYSVFVGKMGRKYISITETWSQTYIAFE